eukprot:568451-Pelagomonas_calceolata.AAC.1
MPLSARMKVEHCEENRPNNQLETSKQQNCDLCHHLLFGETLSSLLVRDAFLNARGLLAGVDFSFLSPSFIVTIVTTMFQLER